MHAATEMHAESGSGGVAVAWAQLQPGPLHCETGVWLVRSAGTREASTASLDQEMLLCHQRIKNSRKQIEMREAKWCLKREPGMEAASETD